LGRECGSDWLKPDLCDLAVSDGALGDTEKPVGANSTRRCIGEFEECAKVPEPVSYATLVGKALFVIPKLEPVSLERPSGLPPDISDCGNHWSNSEELPMFDDSPARARVAIVAREDG
jgi:hypothetical protein